MRLSKLIEQNKETSLKGEDTTIAGITADSRHVKPGFLFVAIPGTTADGRSFIPDAIKNGAVAILAPTGTEVKGASLLTTPDIRKSLSKIAATFYTKQPQTIAAVTGTSGKTSTAQYVREMWQSMGHKSASIGTLGYVTEKEARYGSLTTPDAITLHHLLEESTQEGITHLVMEASSHGLALHRLDNVHIKVGAFTNLSRDHLDYHENMESYLAAKTRLFAEIIEPGGTAILNADATAFKELSAAALSRKLHVMSYGYNGKEIKLIETLPDSKGQKLTIEVMGKRHSLLLPMIGAFQAWNGLCALAMTMASGSDPLKALDALTKVSGVPGRLQPVGHSKTGGAVFIDYAHKPDALENVLKALRPHLASHKGAKLGVIFGCGGNRDKGKRPIMGEIAQRLAEWVIVTDDNPRQEEPAAIRREILEGCAPRDTLREIGDRGEAIRVGIGLLQKNDVLVIAGKGHETGQIVGDTTLPFDDAEVARKALSL